MNDATTPQFLTVKEIAQVLKLNPLTIYDYIRHKKLPAIKFGRYYRVNTLDLYQFIQRLKVK